MLQAGRNLRLVNRAKTSSAFRVGEAERETQELASSLSERLASHKEASSLIVDAMDASTRQKFLNALVASEANILPSSTKTYLDNLFKQYDRKAPFGVLEKAEFESAILADRAARASKESGANVEGPKISVLSIALASSVPFIGMGAVDNAIMLVAGSEIDAAFGAKLGLSTLAAAGLGNMVSDVAGVSIANKLENLTRRVKWFNEAAYKAGSRTQRGRTARLSGSVAGVAIGCLLGMLPLMFMDTTERKKLDL